MKPFVIWLSGKSRSGKTTLANMLDNRISLKSVIIDWKEVIKYVEKDIEISEEDFKENLHKIVGVILWLLSQNFVVIVPALPVDNSVRKLAEEKVIKEGYRFFGFYLKCNDVLLKARGNDFDLEKSWYEEPKDYEEIDTGHYDEYNSVGLILSYLEDFLEKWVY